MGNIRHPYKVWLGGLEVTLDRIRARVDLFALADRHRCDTHGGDKATFAIVLQRRAHELD